MAQVEYLVLPVAVEVRLAACQQARVEPVRRAQVPSPTTSDPFRKDEVAAALAQIHQAPTFEAALPRRQVEAAPWPAVVARLPASAGALAVASLEQALRLAGLHWAARPAQVALGLVDWPAVQLALGRVPPARPEPPPEVTDPWVPHSLAQQELELELLEPCPPVPVPPLAAFLERAPVPLAAVHLSCACRTQGAFANANS